MWGKKLDIFLLIHKLQMCSIVLFIVGLLSVVLGKWIIVHIAHTIYNCTHVHAISFLYYLNRQNWMNILAICIHWKTCSLSCVDHPTCPSLVYFVDLIRMVRWSKVKCILLKVGRHEFLKDVSHRLTILLKFPFMLPPFCHKSYRILIPTVNTITLQT